MQTRKDMAVSLALRGVTGQASEFVLRWTAPQRHAERVAAAKAAAIDFAGKNGAAKGDVPAAVAAILHAEVIGLGGRCGVEGCATLRHPAFAECGKGRRNATDGRAWTAAIEEAAGAYNVTWETDGASVTAWHDGRPLVVYDPARKSNLMPPAWATAVARLGLLATLWADPAVRAVNCRNVIVDDDAESAPWAALVNSLEAAAATAASAS